MDKNIYMEHIERERGRRCALVSYKPRASSNYYLGKPDLVMSPKERNRGKRRKDIIEVLDTHVPEADTPLDFPVQ